MPEVGIGVGHGFSGLFGGGVDGELVVGFVGFSEGQDFVGAIDGGGGGDQKVLDVMAAGNFENVEGADDIAVDIGAGSLQRIADTGLSGEVDDDVGLEGVGGAVEEGLVLKLAFDGGEIWVLEEDLVAAVFEADVVIGGHAVVALNRVAFIKEEFGEVEADEACGAGDEDFLHGG